MRFVKWCLVGFLLMTSFGLSTPVWAQDTTDNGEQAQTSTDGQNGGETGLDASGKAPAEMGLNVDAMVAAGFGSLLYPHIEPAVDIGVLPLGPVTLSVGGAADLGYCLLCGIIDAASDWDVASWYWSIQARPMLHINDLSRQLVEALNVDMYAGATFGPQFYNFRFGYEPNNDSARVNFTTFVFGPVLGAKLFGDKIGLFGYAELRYLFEVGYAEQTIEIDDQRFTLTTDYRRGGSDLTFGLGYRF